MEREELPEEALQQVERDVANAEAALETSEAGRQLLEREIAKMRAEAGCVSQ